MRYDTKQVVSTLTTVAAALRGPDQPATTFQAIERGLKELVGHRMFTFLHFDLGAGTMERLYSNLGRDYPAGGHKPLRGGEWRESLIERGEVFLARDVEALRAVYSDHATLTSLGCGSVLNVPIRHDGVTLGTMNLLDAEGRYDDDTGRIALIFAGFALPAFLAHGRTRST